MRWYLVVLAAAASLLACSAALSAATDYDQTKISAVVARVRATSSNSIGADTSKNRFLRVDKSSHTFKDFNHDHKGDDANDEFVVHAPMLSDSEERAEPLTAAAQSFIEKLVHVLPIKSRLRIWSKHGRSVDFVTKELGLDQMTTAAFKRSRNYKYYDEFMTTQTLVWGRKDLSLDDVLARLGLNMWTQAERVDAVNYKYFEEFVVNQMRSWMKRDLPLDDVMAKLKLEKLSGDALLSHPNYKYYENFVTNKLKTWATDMLTPGDVQVELGMKRLQGRALEAHPNYSFLQQYTALRVTYRDEGWLKQSLSTYDVWQKLELNRVHPILLRGSGVFQVYKSYVNTMDDYIIGLMEDSFTIPNLISKSASSTELKEKTMIWTSATRPETYVKYSLGLDGLYGDALKEAANYKFFEYYLHGLQFIQ